MVISFSFIGCATQTIHGGSSNLRSRPMDGRGFSLSATALLQITYVSAMKPRTFQDQCSLVGML